MPIILDGWTEMDAFPQYSLTCPYDDCGETFSTTDPASAGATMCPECGRQIDLISGTPTVV